MRSGADAIDRPASGFNPDEIVSKVVEVLLDSGLPGIADCDDTDHGSNPDGDSQNRQDASHLVSEQRHKGRPKQGCVIHGFDASALPRNLKLRIKLHHTWAALTGRPHFMLSLRIELSGPSSHATQHRDQYTGVYLKAG